MPIVSTEIEETVETVTRPVIFAVVRNILQRTGLDIDASIYLNKGDNQARNLNSGLMEEPSEAKFSQGERVKVSLEEESSDYGMLENTTPNTDHENVFQDEKLGIWLSPIYHNTTVTLNFEMYFSSEAAAQMWVNGIRRRIGNERQYNKHTFDYHFPIPLTILYILADLYKTREAQHGYGDKFPAWLKECFVDRVSVMTNQAGSSSNFSVVEQQTNVNGWFSFDKPPVAEQNTQQFQASFSYTFEYQKPTAFAMGYPLMVHNQLIPAKLRVRGENFNWINDPLYASNTKSRFMRLMNGPIVPGQSIGGVSIPDWDEWLPPRVRTHYSTLLRIMVQLDPNVPRQLLNLDQLGKVQIDPIIRRHMAKYTEKLTQTYQNVFHIALYKDKTLMPEVTLSVDENLFVNATEDLDPRHQYHVWIGCMGDLSMLSGDALEDFLSDGEELKQIIRIVDSTYEVDDINVLDDGSVSPPRWDVVKTDLKEAEKHYRNRVESNTLTVGQFTLTAQNLGRN